MKTFIFIFCLLISAFASAIQVRVNYTPVANFIYQLDCVSDYTPHCSDKNYKELWNQDFLKDGKDKALLNDWATLMAKYNASVELVNAKSDYTGPGYQGVDLSTKLRMVSFEAKDIEDYISRLDLVMLVRDRVTAEAIIKHFYPRFELWWKKDAAKKGTQFVTSTESILKSKDIKKKIDQFYHFYEADLPSDFRITMNLFFRPDFVKEPTSGQQIENYSVTEFVMSEKPEQRMDVVLHELCHFFFQSADNDKLDSLKKRFNQENSIAATGAYNIMNETLAATFGNGIINKLLMPEERWTKYAGIQNSFYNNYYLDTAAKALMSTMSDWLEAGKTLYDPTFIPKYSEVLQKSLGKELEAPLVLLSDMLFIGDERFKNDFESDLHKNLFMTYAYWGNWTEKTLLQKIKARVDVNTLIVVHPDNFAKLLENKIASNKQLSSIKSAFKKRKALLYGYKRGPSAMTYVIAANDYDAAVKLIEELGKLKVGFEGVFKKQ